MKQEFKIVDLFSRIFELLLLNTLFILTSLPLVTMGASLTALFSVSQKLVKNEESYLARDYFHAFRQNLVRASVTFLLLAAAGILFTMNILIALQNTQSLYLITGMLSLVFLILLGVYAIHYFPLLARESLSHKEILRRTLRTIAERPGIFLALAAFHAPVLFLCIYSMYTLMFVIIAALVGGMAAFVYIETILISGTGYFSLQ